MIASHATQTFTADRLPSVEISAVDCDAERQLLDGGHRCELELCDGGIAMALIRSNQPNIVFLSESESLLVVCFNDGADEREGQALLPRLRQGENVVHERIAVRPKLQVRYNASRS